MLYFALLRETYVAFAFRHSRFVMCRPICALVKLVRKNRHTLP